MSLEQFNEALECFDQACKLDPTHLDSLVNRAFALSRCEKYGDALLAYDKILALAPNDVGAWNGKAVTLYAMGRFKNACEACERALAADPTSQASADLLQTCKSALRKSVLL